MIARYDANLAPHQHVVCVSCRRIRDIEIAELEKLLGSNPALEGYATLGWSLEIQALCDSCRAAAAADSGSSRAHVERGAARR